MRPIPFFASLALLTAAPSLAQDKGEIGYPQGSLGFDAMVSGDLQTAELQLRTSPVAKTDPAVLLNLARVFVRTGRIKEAEAAYRKVLEAPEVELVLSSGQEMGSHRAATLGLRGATTFVSR